MEKHYWETCEGGKRWGRDERASVSRAVNLIKDGFLFFMFSADWCWTLWWIWGGGGEEELSEGEWSGGPERLKKNRTKSWDREGAEKNSDKEKFRWQVNVWFCGLKKQHLHRLDSTCVAKKGSYTVWWCVSIQVHNSLDNISMIS